MADQQQQPQAQQQPQERMQAPFPSPLPFYHHFTKQNISELRRLRKEAGLPTDQTANVTDDDATTKPDLDILALPTELRYLIPPPPPPAGSTFKVFGFERSLATPAPTLAERNVEQLYPDHPAVKLNPQAHLISLARSQLTTFMTLMGNLANDPEMGWEGPAKDIEVLTYNMLDFVNQYRPHQARETLILMMEERVERMKAETNGIEEAKTKVAELMRGLQDRGDGENGPMQVEDVKVGGEVKVERARNAKQKAAWAALEELSENAE